MDFSKILAHHLADANLSAVARKIGMPASVLHDWIKGRRTPSLKNLKYLRAIAAHLNMGLGELLGDEKSPQVLKQLKFKVGENEFVVKVERSLF